MNGTILTLNCTVDDRDYIELYVTAKGNINIGVISETDMVLLDVKKAKKLKKALNEYIKSQEEN